MKKIIIAFLGISLLGQVLNAQEVDESLTFVYLPDNSVVYTENLWMSNGDVIDKSNKKRLYSMYDTRFINAENGFFANTTKVSKRKVPDLAKRIIKGDLNLFESQLIYADRVGTQGAILNPKKYYNYFNKGYEEVKRVSYKSLYPLMSKNTESLAYLDKYRSTQNTGRALYFAGYAAQMGGFYMLFKGMEVKMWNNSAFSTGKHIVLPLGIFLSGFGMQLANNWFNAKKNEYLQKSFMIYNGIKE